jgi:hypothetical protein
MILVNMAGCVHRGVNVAVAYPSLIPDDWQRKKPERGRKLQHSQNKIFPFEMMKQFFVILSVLLASEACDKTHSQGKVREETTSHNQINIWCPFDHDDILQKGGDSVFVFSEEHGNTSMYTLMIKFNSKRNYNVTFCELDSLNPLYNAIDNTPGPKSFFEGMAFRVKADKLNEIKMRLDKLFDETGSESYVDILDGSSFLITYKSRIMSVNTGPMVDKWKEYSIFLQDSVMHPYKELREKGRSEAELKQQ